MEIQIYICFKIPGHLKKENITLANNTIPNDYSVLNINVTAGKYRVSATSISRWNPTRGIPHEWSLRSLIARTISIVSRIFL